MNSFFSDNDGDVVNGLLMVQFDMVDMLRRKKAQKKFQRKRSDRRSFGMFNVIMVDDISRILLSNIKTTLAEV